MEEIAPEDLKMMQLFHPFALKQTIAAREARTRFVHYSSAEAAIKILNSGEVWMRRASAMNDFREIDYGKECLVDAYHGGIGEKLKAIIEPMFPGICQEIAKHFDDWYPHFIQDTYLTCISEHDGDREDRLGRLSMWRAYGGPVGVAVVMNGQTFLTPTDALGAYASPVAYLSPPQFTREFEDLVEALSKERELLRSFGREVILARMIHVFHMATVCTKHPGFHEEREWRVIYNPVYQKSERIIQAPEIINGVPQLVQKIPLKDVPEEGLVGLSVDALIERIIIGPTNFPYQVREAFIEVLKAKGMANAGDRVVVSDIPLRHG